MNPLCFKRHRFPADVIKYAVWAYFRFTMSFRDVEDLLAERGVLVSNESIRCWTLKFGPAIAHNLRRTHPAPTPRWHLDEMVVKIAGVRMYMWRAVDDEGEVLDVLVQKRRNKAAAVKFLRRILKSTEIRPEAIVTDGLYSYRSATRALRCADRHKPGRLRENNRVENSHLPVRRRERKMQKCKSQGCDQRVVSIPSAVCNTFAVQPHLVSRPSHRVFRREAFDVWSAATAAA